MSYVQEVFKRGNLQNIVSFLLNGTEVVELTEKDYDNRLSEANDSIESFIKNNFTEEKYNMASDEIRLYIAELESIYMELGLKIGMNLTKSESQINLL